MHQKLIFDQKTFFQGLLILSSLLLRLSLPQFKFQIDMYTIENDSHVSSEDGVEKGQCYQLVKRSNTLKTK